MSNMTIKNVVSVCPHGYGNNLLCPTCDLGASPHLKASDYNKPARPFAWFREDGGRTIFARGDWPPPEPDDTAWLPLYRHPEIEK